MSEPRGEEIDLTPDDEKILDRVQREAVARISREDRRAALERMKERSARAKKREKDAGETAPE